MPRSEWEKAVPWARDFLDRFRPAAAPGGALGAAVPADRARELAAELGPVLARLDDVYADCAAITAQAGREAALIVERARVEAAWITTDGEQRAWAARQEAAARALAEAAVEAREATAVARQEAAMVRKRAAARLPGLVARAVAQARAGPGGFPRPPAARDEPLDGPR